MLRKIAITALALAGAILILAGCASPTGSKSSSNPPNPPTGSTVRVTTLAGNTHPYAVDGTDTATFRSPNGVAVDSTGNVYVADTENNMIRKITPAGVVTTFAGSTTRGHADGTGTAASFYQPGAVAVDSSDNVYVADSSNSKIRKITPAGVVTTFAGSTTYGDADGTGTAASFSFPNGIAIDSSDNLYIADTSNNKIRKITPAGVVTTLAGSGSRGSNNGTGTAASFYSPYGVAVDGSGNVYVGDTYNSMIRKITPAGVVTNLAPFTNPYGLTVDASGNVYAGDINNAVIRKVSPAGVVTTLAGSSGNNGYADGTGTGAFFNNPMGVAVDASGDVYVGDYNNHLVRKVTSAGVVTTVAGTRDPRAMNGTGTAASFYGPCGTAVDASGNVYVADGGNNLIRKITSAGVVTTFAGNASFNGPGGVAVDTSGNVYVADSRNNLIRKITPAGVVTTLAGSGNYGSDDGTGTAASFASPSGVAVDASDNVYVADSENNLIRKITPAGVVTTLAGFIDGGYADGTGANALFSYPAAVAVDTSGNVYVADSSNNAIRKITPAGVVTTLAGSVTGNSGSANGTGTAASFDSPSGVAVDASGNVYVADSSNNMIRRITSAGLVSTWAGSTDYGSSDGIGTAASFNYPAGVSVDAQGTLYIADSSNGLIRVIR